MPNNNIQLIKTIANIITTNLLPLSQKYEKDIQNLIDEEAFIYIAELYNDKKINNQGLLLALENLIENNISGKENAIKQVEKLNILQIENEAELEKIVNVVINDNPKQVEQFKSGKEQVLGFLVGQCMKASKGKGNASKFSEILKKSL